MKILIVSPHPDDESLGAGGFILKHKANGDQVYWLNVTDTKDSDRWGLEFIERRKEQLSAIEKYYQFDKVYNLGFEPATLGSNIEADLIRQISRAFQDIEPDWLVIPNPYDAHSDHKAVYDACMSCSKVFRYAYIKKIMTMEIISETDFSKTMTPFAPNYFVDIDNELERKIEALAIYDTEMGEPPFPRNSEAIRALALLRGGMAGCRYAEAFCMIKEIES